MMGRSASPCRRLLDVDGLEVRRREGDARIAAPRHIRQRGPELGAAALSTTASIVAANPTPVVGPWQIRADSAIVES
jgi:hypothetical protein